jgi:hypothetical protein
MSAVSSGSLSRRPSLLAAMLTIGNSASPELRSKYCAAQVAAGAEDYHPSRDESPGQWRVSGASAGDCEQSGALRRSVERS